MGSGYAVNTVVMATNIAYSFLICLIQFYSDGWNKKKRRTRHTAVLYSVYLSSILCAVQCLMMHNSHHFPHFYCKYGMGICIIFYSLEKCCMYTFFLNRARITQGDLEVFPHILFQKILPAWILLYIVSFAIVSPIFYRGKVARPAQQSGIVTGCLFVHDFPWLFSVASVIDVINCVGFLILFIIPWRRSIQVSACNFKTTTKQLFRRTVRWNIILSAISSLSSVSFLIFMAISSHTLSQYAWLGGNVDMFVNMSAVFFMLGTNRAFCYNKAMALCVMIYDTGNERLAATVLQQSNVSIGPVPLEQLRPQRTGLASKYSHASAFNRDRDSSSTPNIRTITVYTCGGSDEESIHTETATNTAGAAGAALTVFAEKKVTK